MPLLFRKKNKYGVAPRDGSQNKGTVRPLSVTFGNSLNHLDEEDVNTKKAR